MEESWIQNIEIPGSAKRQPLWTNHNSDTLVMFIHNATYSSFELK